MINLFVTGMLRSGTTLLEKALNCHPDIRIAYQPFPEIFIQIKKEFFRHIKIAPEYHALSHYCRESRYTPQNFMSWLDNQRFSNEFFHKWLPESKKNVSEKPENNCGFSDWYSFLVAQMSPNTNKRCIGSKEVLMEEFVPCFIKHDTYCIIIIRDPRDVISSLDYGSGKQFTGDHRPTLFNLRNWRKSLYYAFAFEEDPHLAAIKFEDLVAQPLKALNQIAEMIGFHPFNDDLWQHGLRDENGVNWKGNSSFGDISPFSTKSIGGHSKVLPDQTRFYIEAVCRREMLAMGYEVSPSSVAECKERIKGFVDPFAITRSEFAADYSSSAANVGHEIERIEKPDSNSFLFASTAKKIMDIHL